MYWIEKIGKCWIIMDANTNGENGWRKSNERYYTVKKNADARLAALLGAN